ncbi:hypothetical protein QL285_012700 [Trifolium repens]|nr:hypothetical protein QL285_012700 [Trifolium repens]
MCPSLSISLSLSAYLPFSLSMLTRVLHALKRNQQTPATCLSRQVSTRLNILNISHLQITLNTSIGLVCSVESSIQHTK